MKPIEKQHKLILVIFFVFFSLLLWVGLRVAFSQEQLSPDIQALQNQVDLIQGELNYLNAEMTMKSERMKSQMMFRDQLKAQITNMQRQAQMEKARAEEARKKIESEKTKVPEKK